jgi:hypothetical protein
MNEEPRAETRKIRAAFSRVKSGLTLGGFVVLAVGILVGFLVSQSFTHFREHSRLSAARQNAEALFNKLTPKAETQLHFLSDRLDEIRKQVAQGILATNAVAVAADSYDAQQKRMEMELDQVDRVLGQLAAFTDQAAHDFKGRSDLELLPPGQQQKLAELQARYDTTRTGLMLLASEVSYAKERRLKMALAEAQAAQAVQAEALRQARADAQTAERARAEAMQRLQSEASQRAQADTIQRSQTDSAQRTQNETLQRLLEIALLRSQPEAPACQTIYVQPAVSYANDFLVIGQRYHAAYHSYYYPGYYPSYRPCYGYYGSSWFY